MPLIENTLSEWFYGLELGLASFNPVAASPLVGFGDPPKKVQINYSILDLHGLNDDTIPYNADSIWCYGNGPHGSLISQARPYNRPNLNYITQPKIRQTLLMFFLCISLEQFKLYSTIKGASCKYLVRNDYMALIIGWLLLWRKK